MEKENSYDVLSNVNIKHLVKRKGNQDYLSWASAWNELKKVFPDAQRTVYCNAEGMPYFTDGNTALVKVGITVNGLEHIDMLAVMDHRNKAIPVDRITTFEIVKTIQRSTAKAIAMHGLGLNLWTGEDIVDTPKKVTPPKVAPKVFPKANITEKDILEALEGTGHLDDKLVDPMVKRWKKETDGKIYFDKYIYIIHNTKKVPVWFILTPEQKKKFNG